MAPGKKTMGGGAEMRKAGGNDQGTPSLSDQPGSVALSHAECERLVRQWAAAELAQIRRVWYASASAGYQDYEPPRDPEARQEREIRQAETDWGEIDRAGWCVLTIRAVHRVALVAHYRDGSPVGRHARAAALDAFGRAWASWSAIVDGPLNPY